MPPRSRPKRITLSKIAEISGVSRQVVSLIVSGKEGGSTRFSDDTRDRVLKVVDETGYRPNRTVKGFFEKRHGVIGVLGHSPYHIALDALATMMTRAHDFDQMLNIEYVEDGKVPRMIAEDCVDGLILFETVDDELMREIRRFRLPVIQVNTNQRFDVGCVTFDEEAAVKQAVERFAARHCRVPGIICDPAGRSAREKHYSTTVRIEAFIREAERVGMETPVIGTGIGVYEDHFSPQPVLDFLRQYPQLDCILALQDGLVPGIYDAAGMLGRSVPDDLAVIAWNNSHIAKTVRPGLTTLSIDHKRLGELAVELLNGVLEDGELPDPIVRPFQLIERESS